jgi:hypothetical protein
VGGVFLESGVAIDSSATMIQDVAIAFKAKNFSNAIALLSGGINKALRNLGYS